MAASYLAATPTSFLALRVITKVESKHNPAGDVLSMIREEKRNPSSTATKR
jgi:hypothetical protein